MLALIQTLYTAEVTAKNGRNGHVRSSDGSVDLDLAAPPALGGSGKPGANPEQLFAAGYSACFIGAIQYQAMQQKLKPGDIIIDAKVSIGPTEGDNGFTLAVALDVSVAAWIRPLPKGSYPMPTAPAPTPTPPGATSWSTSQRTAACKTYAQK
jgi:osmotically inducible protein OsmC